MDQFQKTYNLLTLNQEETDNLNPLITSSKIEFVILKKKTLPGNKTPGLDGFTGKFYQTYKEELIPLLLKLFQKVKRMEYSQILSTMPPLPQYQNHKKTLQKKKITSLMNVHAKILNKLLAN